MKYLHTMIRVRDLDATLKFFCDGLGLRERPAGLVEQPFENRREQAVFGWH